MDTPNQIVLGNYHLPDQQQPSQQALVQSQPAQEVTTDTLNKPRFYTNLKLADGGRAMLAYAIQRITEVRREVGLNPQNQVEADSWLWLRERNDLWYQGDLSWRLAMSRIFQKSNFTMGSGLRHTRFISAKVSDDLLGTTPFLKIMGENPGKEVEAEQLDKHFQDELDRSDVQNDLREGMKIALYRNECVMKIGWAYDSTPFIGPGAVYCDPTGQPVITPDKGLYVYRDDAFIPHPDVANLMVLESDPSFRATGGNGVLVQMNDDGTQGPPLQVVEFENLPQRFTLKDCVEVKPLDHKAFMCPLRHGSIHDADINVHFYEESVANVRAKFGGIDTGAAYFSWWDRPGASQAKLAQGETDAYGSMLLEKVQIAEVYMRYNPDKGTANDDGEDKEILLILDWKNQQVIYYNYLANHMNRRPFEVIPGLEKVPNRWYGRGIYSLTFDQQMYTDASWNRANAKSANSARVIFGRKEACTEWNNGLQPVIGSPNVYWLTGDFDDAQKKPIFAIDLDDTTLERDKEMFEIVQQTEDSIIGSISNRDASQSDLNSSKTATGVVNIQQTGDLITKDTEQAQAAAINKILEQAIYFILNRMSSETLKVTDGGQLVSLKATMCRSLDRDVRLLLTRSKSTLLQQVSQQAIQIGKDYWALRLQNPVMAKALRPLYIDGLKGLEQNDADDVCPEIPDEEIQQWQAAQANAAQGQQKESLSISYKDTPPDIKRQMEAEAGFTPSSGKFDNEATSNKQSNSTPPSRLNGHGNS